jgi:hypothetical protein
VRVVVLAQAWRGGSQHQISRVLKGCDIGDDERTGRAAEVACAASGITAPDKRPGRPSQQAIQISSIRALGFRLAPRSGGMNQRRVPVAGCVRHGGVERKGPRLRGHQ